MDVNETRKLKKLLNLTQEQVYHVFCLAVAIGVIDDDLDPTEAEMLTRIGFGLGLKPKDIEILAKDCQDAIRDTSISDVLAFSIVRLNQLMTHEQLEGIILVLEFITMINNKTNRRESEVINIACDVWLKNKPKTTPDQ